MNSSNTSTVAAQESFFIPSHSPKTTIATIAVASILSIVSE
jgi:hypothetical protein